MGGRLCRPDRCLIYHSRNAIRLFGQEIQVFHPAEWSKGVVNKAKVEGVKNISLSPGLNPSVAVFVAEKNVRTFVNFAACRPI